jgi:hypothetical protein
MDSVIVGPITHKKPLRRRKEPLALFTMSFYLLHALTHLDLKKQK